MSYNGPDRRKHEFPDELIELIAERAADRAFEKVYADLGRNVTKKILWVVGAGALGLFVWLAGNGHIK